MESGREGSQFTAVFCRNLTELVTKALGGERVFVIKMDLPWYISFLSGALSSTTAELVTYPMDMLKTRMHLRGTQGVPRYSSMLHAITHTYHSTGLTGYFQGITPALTRQFHVSGIKILLFNKLKYWFKDDLQSGSFIVRFGNGATAGGISALICNPLDVCKIRLVNDIGRVKYKGMFDCMKKTLDEGFFLGFYKGSSPNVYRSIVVSAAELGTYDSCKGFLMTRFDMQETSLWTRFWASVMAGFVGSVCTSPIDVVKSRYMNARRVPSGSEAQYSSPYDCLRQIVRKEGFRALYAGFGFLWMRLGPWCVVMLVAMDELRDKMTEMHRQRS